MSDENQKPADRRTLWLILAVCLAPFIGSILAYLYWQPDNRINYGELLPPAELPAVQFKQVDGTPFDLAQLRGKWIYLTADSGACDDYCREKLWKMRQVRRTRGKDMERVERVWLVTDDQRPATELLADHEGMFAVAAKASPFVAQLPHKGGLRDHIYLMDPLGNLVLRYPRDADPNRMKKDLNRLLKVSRIG